MTADWQECQRVVGEYLKKEKQYTYSRLVSAIYRPALLAFGVLSI
jgi:hypothetical protein